jgi:hypothetical protein
MQYQPTDTISNGVGFKAIEKLGGQYVSPKDNEFVWGEDGIVTAVCKRQQPYNWNMDISRISFVHGDSWHSAADIPHENCTCGLYCAFEFGDATLYEKRAPQAVLILAEAAGPTIYYHLGFRSQQCKVRAIVGNVKRTSDDVACNYFKVPFFTLDVAKDLLDIQNYRVSRQCHEPWDYKPFYLDEKTIQSRSTNLAPLIHLEVEDPTEAIWVENWPFK